MNGGIKLTAFLALALSVRGAGAAAPIVVNEVLANEPGGQTSLEWIELFNDGAAPVSLDRLTLDISGTYSVSLPNDIVIDAGGYYLVCRRLYPAETSVGFEGAWGNGSGQWGDCDQETVLPVPFEASFALTNASGYVALVDPDGFEQSRLSWHESGIDGRSWERITPDRDSVAQSFDPRGGTPGGINSAVPVAHDLALGPVRVRSVNGAAEIEIEVSNLGTGDPGQSFMEVGLCLDSGCTETTAFDSVTIASPVPGERTVLTLRYVFEATYNRLVVSLPTDDRPANNRIELVAPGRAYPPLLLSEFLANPSGELESEWIELFNRSDTAVDLVNWMIGDSRTLVPICSDSGQRLDPGSYAVLAQDSVTFRLFYPGGDVPIVPSQSWPTLNNTGDSIRLVGPYNIEADRCAYTEVFDNNRTWCRDVTNGPEARWGCSRTDGGTPGAANEPTFISSRTSIRLTVSPRIFAPDRGQAVAIEVATSDTPATVRLFDRQGRVVRTFNSINGEVEWAGQSDSGRQLPVGMYIVVAETETGESARETVVMAR